MRIGRQDGAFTAIAASDAESITMGWYRASRPRA